MICYCRGEICRHPGGVIPEGARKVDVDAVTIDWGAEDLRTPWSGEAVFGSFACGAKWFSDRAADHDDRVLVDGVHEAYGNEEPQP